MSGSTESNRVKCVDVFKGVAIVAIIFVHLLYLVPGKDTGMGASVFEDFMFTGVLAFFLISGYFYRPVRSVAANIKRRLKQVLVPYYAFTLILPFILFAYLVCLGYGITVDMIWDTIGLTIIGNNAFLPLGTTNDYATSVVNGYYFLEILLFGLIIFYVLVDRVIEKPKVLLATVIVLVTVTGAWSCLIPVNMPFHINLAPMAAAMMLIGAYCARYKFLEKLESSVRTPKFWIFLFTMLAASLLLLYVFPTHAIFRHSYFGEIGFLSVFPFFASSVTGSFSLLSMSVIGAKIPLFSTIFGYIGVFTLPILFMHTFFSKIIIAPFFQLPLVYDSFPVMPIEVTVVVGILVIVACIVTSKVMTKVVERIKERRDTDSTDP